MVKKKNSFQGKMFSDNIHSVKLQFKETTDLFSINTQSVKLQFKEATDLFTITKQSVKVSLKRPLIYKEEFRSFPKVLIN